jgi:hypothetical protein
MRQFFNQPFASIMQAILVVWLLLSIALIGQQADLFLYRVGLISLGISTVTQIAFGNILPTANFTQSMRMFAIILTITAALFALSAALVPYLAALGR